VSIVQSLVRSGESLIGHEATTDAVINGLEKCTWAHFACHALQDLDQPTKSALFMHDGPLTLARIVQSSLSNAQFAFLSACQSAAGSKFLPNESVHIAAGLQFAGFRSIVGTMWSIHDQDGPFIANEFYGHLFKDGATLPHPSDTAYALNRAVQQLRKEQLPAARWVPFIHIGI